MDNNKAQTRAIFLFCIIIVSWLLAGCQAPGKEVKKTGSYFNTVISITLYGSDADRLITDCFQLCSQYEKLLSRTIESSEINKINHRPKGTRQMELDEDTASLIEAGLSFSRLSDGAFDLTIEPLSELWDFTGENPSVPEAGQIEALLPSVDYRTLNLHDTTLSFASDQTKIDAGAIAKGYIADKLKEYLVSQGVEHGLINLGDNLLCIGSKPDGSDFRIGVQEPFGQQNEAALILSLTDKSIVTSGVYERYFKQDGILYHHLLNPATGYPFQNGLLSVTIVSDSSLDGDGYSTTCFALGLEKGMALVEHTEGIEAVFITEDGQPHYSTGMEPYLAK